MRNCLLVALVLPLTFACQRTDQDSVSDVEGNACQAQVTSLRSENKQLRSTIEGLHDDFVSQVKLVLNEKKPAVWGCDDLQATAVVRKLPMPSADLSALIAAFNQVHKHAKQPNIELSGIERDTAIVTVDDPDLLTHRMGSTGAMCYLAGATFTLTSLKGIDSVWFDFQEGDHASPGRYDRTTYLDMIDVAKKE